MLAPGLQDSLKSVPFCKSHESSLDSLSKDLDSIGSQIGIGNIGQSAGIGTPTSLQVKFRIAFPS